MHANAQKLIHKLLKESMQWPFLKVDCYTNKVVQLFKNKKDNLLEVNIFWLICQLIEYVSWDFNDIKHRKARKAPTY